MHGRRGAAVVLAAMLGSVVALGAPRGGNQVPAETRGKETPDADPRTEDAIARDLANRRPGPEHRWLEPLAGTWKIDITRYALTGEGTHLTGSAENRWILGGRFLVCESSAGEGNARAEATTIYGFDNGRQQFFALGLDSHRTNYLQLDGNYDPNKRSFILSGKERDEATGHLLVYRELLRIEGPDRHVLQFFLDVPGRPPLKTFEAVFTRP